MVAILSLIPSATQIVLGDTVTVNLDIADCCSNLQGQAVDLGAYQLVVVWDPHVLRCESVVVGDFLDNPLSERVIDNVRGAFVMMGASIVGASGNGRLATATFTAIGGPSTTLQYGSALVLDTSYDSHLWTIPDRYGQTIDIPFTTVDTAITVTLPSATVMGTVTDSATGAPLEGVSVTLDGYATSTDALGNYTFTVPIGPYTLAATKTGYNPYHTPLNLTTPGGTYQENITLTHIPDFSVAASPDSLSIPQGTTGTSKITISSIQGFNQPVLVTVSGMPTGMVITPNPYTVTPPPNGYEAYYPSIVVNAGTSLGTYSLTVMATSASLIHSTAISVKVIPPPDFSLAAVPSSLTIPQGSSGSSTITATSINGFNAPIILSVSGDEPSGVYVSIESPITPPANGSANSALAIEVRSFATPGTYTLTITGISGTWGTHTTTVTLNVTAPPPPDFSLAAVPSSLTVPQGSSGSSTVRATSINGFNSPIDLSVNGQPTGVTATLTTPITPPADGSIDSTLNVQVDASVAIGTYTLTITGISGSLTHTTTVTLDVTALPQKSTVTGTVTGILWRPIKGAKVTLNGKTTTTDSSGLYTIDNVANGTYTLSVESTLYETFKTEVDITSADTYTMDVQLGLLNVKRPILITGGVIFGIVTIVGAIVVRRKR